MGTVVSVFGINPFRIGGQEAFARELSLQLGRYGWNSVLCFDGHPPDVVRQYLELPNVSLEVLEHPERVTWRSLNALARVLHRYRPQILHLYYTSFVGPYPWLARLCSVGRVFFTDESSRPEAHVPQRAAGWKRGMARLVNWPLTGVICASGYGHRCMTVHNLLPEDRFHVVYNAVDLSRVSNHPDRAAAFRQRFSIPDGRAVVVQVSWIIPEKGILDLLEAARRVVARNPRVHFVLVGEGAYREQFARRAEEWGLKEHVTWTGLVKDPFGEGVYDVADLVCQVSRWEELFGYVIAEGMAFGKPVVATRVGGIPEVVQDGVTGFLVARGDAGQIAEKILQLVDDPPLRERLGRAGRLAVEEKFDVRRTAGQVLQLYGVANGPAK